MTEGSGIDKVKVIDRSEKLYDRHVKAGNGDAGVGRSGLF